MSSWRHLRNGLVVIIRTITGLARDYPLLLSKLLLLYSYNTPNNIILLGYSLWHLRTTVRLTRCCRCTMLNHLCHVIGRELCGGTTVLSKHLWRPHCDCPVDKECDLVSIGQLPVTSEALSYSVLHL